MKPSHRRVIVPLVVLATLSCAAGDTESWGFVATLGNDTTSVERVTRQGNHIVSEAVGRSPVVVRRRWEATLAPDGRILRWSMDTHIPNAPPGEADLHHEVELGNGMIHLVRRTAAGSTDRTFRDPYVRTAPWNAFVYGTYGLLFRTARGLPDSTHVGQYFFEGWAEGRLGYAQVRRLGDGRVAIRSTGLAGSGVRQDAGRRADPVRSRVAHGSQCRDAAHDLPAAAARGRAARQRHVHAMDAPHA